MRSRKIVQKLFYSASSAQLEVALVLAALAGINGAMLNVAISTGLVMLVKSLTNLGKILFQL